MAYPTTFVDLQNAVIQKARLDATLDLPRVKDWVNQVYAQVCVETEANVAVDTMTLTAGASSYTLPAGIARIKQMYLTPDGSTQSEAPLTRTSLDEILYARRSGGNVQQSGQYAFLYTVVGLNQLEVYPTPATDDMITLWMVQLPAELVNDSDVPILQEPYASRLLEYGTLVLAGEFNGDPMTPNWQAMFDQWMGKYREHLEKRGGLSPGQFQVWGGSSGYDSQGSGSNVVGYW